MAVPATNPTMAAGTNRMVRAAMNWNEIVVRLTAIAKKRMLFSSGSKMAVISGVRLPSAVGRVLINTRRAEAFTKPDKTGAGI